MTRIRCVCPRRADGSERHPEGDEVTLQDRLDFTGALVVRNRIRAKEDTDDFNDVLASLTDAFLAYGIESWTLLDERGKPVDVDRDTIRTFLNEHPMEAMAVGNDADALYTPVVVLPLIESASKSSPRTPTDPSTSRPTGSPTKRRTRPSPSSTTTTPTDDTETTSPSLGGDSNSLPN